ncbi:MAG: hypothetical protein ABSG43_22895 [Solirubrobacteraceae bacterium]
MKRYLAWSGALGVTVVTAVLVVLDIGGGSVHQYWSRHSFTASVLSGLLVLLLTVLIVDRVASNRQLRNQSRAIGAQAAIIVGQAARAADAITSVSPGTEDREAAADELRTYAQMLLVSAPVLIGAQVPRTFLETAQRLAAQMFRALRDSGDESVTKTRLDQAVAQLRAAAAPLLDVLNREQRAAVSAEEGDRSET